ncbi:hypothetical protein [Clostridium ganghwense]|uniref:DUF4878 domain-containing protein n=1 Tax=Clostridium ganghwense TaxID=312089 RepID=A0ABT4CLY4_9CLOT|nr:hypothetical protein [Clostridium ganghwense]MCY6370057.1 hypothetical protein [Clostridium ganghwense]
MKISKKYFNVLSLLIIFTLSLSFISCGSSAVPDDSVKAFFGSLQKQDFKTASTYVKDANNSINFDNPQQKEIVNKIVSKLQYEIISSTTDGDTAKVKTKITSPDLVKVTGKMVSDLLPTLFAQALNGEKTDQAKTDKMVTDYFIKNIDDPKVEMISNEVEINLVKNKNTWLLVGDDDLINAITGNLTKAFADLSTSAQ